MHNRIIKQIWNWIMAWWQSNTQIKIIICKKEWKRNDVREIEKINEEVR